VLGWRPRVGLEEGLRIGIDWFRARIARGNPVIGHFRFARFGDAAGGNRDYLELAMVLT
jgi:hypothetical protein